MNWKQIREIFRQVHLWIGLAGGLFIFIIALSGALLVYEDDVLEILNPEVFDLDFDQGEVKEISSLINTVEAGTKKEVQSFRMNSTGEHPWEFNVKKKGEKGRPEGVFINPATAEILGKQKELTGRNSMFFLFKLHRWFLMDSEIGRPIVGYCTLAFIISMLTGLVIWFPKKIKNYKNGFKVKWNARWKRINHDFHNAFGLYSALFLLLLAITGLFWSFEWYRAGMSDLIGAEVFDRLEKNMTYSFSSKDHKEPDEVFKIVRNELKNYGDLRFGLAKKEENLLEVNAYKKGFLAISIPDTYVYDYSNGELLSVQKFSDLPINEKMAKSVHDLHMGFLFGPVNKFLFFISSLIGALLPVTGFLIWWNKRRKRT